MRGKASIGVTVVVALAAAVAPSVSIAEMRSVKMSNKLCQTTGGGKFVDIPGFPGEKIDRRLLRDIRYLRRNYKIFITDGYSKDPVHSANGEHPRGLALDIVPNFAAGGDWNDIDRLAKWAEPTQNGPRYPLFRWVGYNGDAHHGRGHHLHLSYNHSGANYGEPAKTMYSIKCPRKRRKGDGDGAGDGGGGTGGGISARSASDILAPVEPETGGVGL